MVLQATLERHENTIAELEHRIRRLEAMMGPSEPRAVVSGTATAKRAEGSAQTAFKMIPEDKEVR